MVFGISPTADVATPQQTLQAAFSTPYSGQTFGGIAGENFEEAAGGTDFGIGSVVRDLSTPAAAGIPRPGPLSFGGPLGMAMDANYQGIKAVINAFRPPSAVMSKQDYEQSPNFRDDIPYDPGMTEARAAALAAQSDTTKSRAFFSQIQPVQAFVGSLAGMAVDPINYIPIGGEAVMAAAGARFGAGFLGKLGAHMLSGASEAAMNTAAFGALSSQLRAQYGDDTSLATYGNEVFMAGVLGAGFGAAHGAFAAMVGRGESQAAARQSLELLKIRDAQTTTENLIRARIAGNDAVGSLATKGRVELQPTAIDAVQRISDDLVARSHGQRALSAETSTVGKPVVEGEAPKSTFVVTPQGSRVEVRPEVVDASTLQAAAGANQVRDRSQRNINSAAWIEDTASKLDPARLMPNIEAGNGSPLVGADNTVDSGNGRVAAIIRASEAYPDKFAAYRQAIVDAGYQIPDGVKTPVLINRRVTPLSDTARSQFNAEANAPTVAQMSPVEIAAMDRVALDEPTMAQLADAPINSPANRAFVGAFMSRLGPTERGALLDRDGNLNQSGVQRMENALVARAYADVDDGVLRKFAEATDDNTRAIVGAMSDIAGRWAMMRTAIRRGEIAPEFDMTPELTGALRNISKWRDQAAAEGRPVSAVIKEGMAQVDMFSGDMTPEAKAMIRALYTSDDFVRAIGRDRVAGRLTKMLDLAHELGKPQLFGAPEIDKLGVIDHGARDGERDLFQTDPVEPGAQGVSQGGGGHSPGPDSGVDRQATGGNDGERSLFGQSPDNAGPTGGIAETMASRFKAAGRPDDEAAAAGSLIDAFYRSQASRLGVPVEDLVNRFGLPDVQQGGAMDGARMLAQSAVPDPRASLEAWKDTDITHPYGQTGDFHDLGDKPRAQQLLKDIAEAKSVEGATVVADKWVHKHGAIEGVEHLVGFDDKGGLLVVGSGQHNRVEFPGYFNKAVADGKVVYGTHNHPRNSGLSAPDLISMLIGSAKRDPGNGMTITAMGSKGSIATAKPGPLVTPKFFERGWGKIGEVLAGVEGFTRSFLQDKVNLKEVAHENATLGHAHINNILLHRLGVIDLRSNAPQILDKLGLSADQLLEGLGRAKLNLLAKNLGLDVRDLRTFEPTERLGGLTGEPQGAARANPDRLPAGSSETPHSGRGASRQQKVDPRQLTLFQSGVRGAYEVRDDGSSAVHLFENADASTALHEAGHHFLTMFKGMAEHPDAPAALKADWETVKGWWHDNADAVAKDSAAHGVTAEDVHKVLATGTSGDTVKDLGINVGLQEQWARAFESYLRDGRAPVSGLRGVFEQFKAWLGRIYQSAKDLNINVSDEVRGVFDRMLGGDERAMDSSGGAGVANQGNGIVDASLGRPDPVPEGLDAAAASVGTPESLMDMAKANGVDLASGEYVEHDDVKALAERGGLTDDEKAELAAADENYARAESYGQALKAAASCLI